MVSRRHFLKGSLSLAFTGLSLSLLGCKPNSVNSNPPTPVGKGYGPLVADPNGLLDLPEGFSYSVISELDNTMNDGLPVPDRADGMGCFKLDDDRVVLVRNHELHPKHIKDSAEKLQQLSTNKAYDSFNDGTALPGGTSNIVYNLKSQKVENEFLSLIGTIRNCAGGVTPWNTWLTCEESVMTKSSKLKQDHGYIFEVPADAKGLVDPVPLKAMGRFNHEAAAVDPKTSIVYLTEDTGDSLFYRFIPNTPAKLSDGGKLQALMIKNQARFDSRNWKNTDMPINQWFDVEWVDLDNPEAPEDDLRLRGHKDGAALFARGEGIHWADKELYFCCTNGGHKKLGQIMRYQPSAYEGTAQEAQNPGRIQLFLESSDESLFNFGDNLTVMPNGELMVCEDQYTDETNNYLRGVTNDGKVYEFGRIRVQTEPAGACFSPDGNTMFVNLYSPTRTLAISGPFLNTNS